MSCIFDVMDGNEQTQDPPPIDGSKDAALPNKSPAAPPVEAAQEAGTSAKPAVPQVPTSSKAPPGAGQAEPPAQSKAGEHALPPYQGPRIYEGLKPWQRLTIVICAVMLAGLTLYYAGTQSQALSERLYFTKRELAHIEKLAARNPNDIVAHAMQSQAHVKALANQQALCMLGVGAGVALFILGFALSLIGADGTFKVASTRGEKDVSASGTTPGILCFLCGTVLVALSVSRTHNIKFEGTTVKVTEEPGIDRKILEEAP